MASYWTKILCQVGMPHSNILLSQAWWCRPLADPMSICCQLYPKEQHSENFFQTLYFAMPSAKWWPFCPGLNIINCCQLHNTPLTFHHLNLLFDDELVNLGEVLQSRRTTSGCLRLRHPGHWSEKWWKTWLGLHHNTNWLRLNYNWTAKICYIEIL